MLGQIGRGLLGIPLEVAFDDRRHGVNYGL